MNELAQQLVVLGVVAGALAFLGARAWRKAQAARHPKPGCGSDCGCG